MKKVINNFNIFILFFIFILRVIVVESQLISKEWISIEGVGDGKAETPENWDPSGVPTIINEVNLSNFGDDLSNLTINNPMSIYSMTNWFLEVDVKGPLTCQKNIENQWGEFTIRNNITAVIYNNTYFTDIKGPSHFNATIDNYGLINLYYGVIFYKDVINRYGFFNKVIAPLMFRSSFVTSDPDGETSLLQLKDFYIYGNLTVTNQASMNLESIESLEVHGVTFLNKNSKTNIVYSNLVLLNDCQLIEGANLTLTESTIIFLFPTLDPTKGLLMNNSGGVSNEFKLSKSSIVLSDYSFRLEYNSVMTLLNSSISAFNSNLRFSLNSIISLTNSSIASNDTKLIMTESSLFTLDKSYYVVLVDESLNPTICVLYDTSRISLVNNSTFAIQGPIHLKDNSRLTVDNSLLLIQRAAIFLKDNSSVSIIDSVLQFSGDYYMSNSSTTYIKNSTLYIFGHFSGISSPSFHAFNSSINIQNSMVLVTSGLVIFDYTVLNIFSNGSLFFGGPNFLIQDSLVYIGNYFYSYGSIVSINSTFLVYRNFEILGEFYGQLLKIEVYNGNLTILSDTSFVCQYCDIDIKSGQFVTMSNTSITLKGTTIKNGGKFVSGGDIHLSPGSSITNNNEFILSSNILSSNDDSKMYLENQGKFTFINDSKVQVPMNSSGQLIIGKNQVEVESFKQEMGGLFSLESGSMFSSKSIIQFHGGSIIGNGSFIGNVSNSAAIIGDSNSTIINKIKIDGNYQHDSNATIIFNVENEKDFSSIEILNEILVNGGLVEIRINIEFLESILNQYSNNNITSKIDLISFNSLFNGTATTNSTSNTTTTTTTTTPKNTLGLDNITFKSYDKNNSTNEKVLSNDCISTSSSSSKFSLLLKSCTPSKDIDGGENNNKPITSKAWIAGPIIGVVALTSIAIVIYVKKDRLSIFFKLKKISFGAKLKAIRSKN
ncbi:hypothetical protein RB653_001470 [Dictyostelium firmibasis]|uniref:Transmembrane protein n=1 Tax=Dictyostelium firmibasis TaxID=79012 RepID=A0AAN7YYQ4_9MYCE